jgi:hypothetical protein
LPPPTNSFTPVYPLPNIPPDHCQRNPYRSIAAVVGFTFTAARVHGIPDATRCGVKRAPTSTVATALVFPHVQKLSSSFNAAVRVLVPADTHFQPVPGI